MKRLLFKWCVIPITFEGNDLTDINILYCSHKEAIYLY